MLFVSEGGSLRPGEFYIPRRGELGAPEYVPRSMGRFIALFRELFDTGFYVPKYLDLDPLEDVANHMHILVRVWETDEWAFQCFAPACAACTGMDLTGARISDTRLERYNLQLDTRLERLVRQKPRAYDSMQASDRKLSLHGLFVPMSDTGQTITPCLIMVSMRRGPRGGHFGADDRLSS